VDRGGALSRDPWQGGSDEGFVAIDWSAPIDVAQRLAAVPDRAVVKGMFFRRYLDELGESGDRRYSSFKDYPLRDLMALQVRVARARHPDVPLREGLRRVGWLVFPTLLDSLVGRVLFGVLERDVGRIVSAVSKGYSLVQTTGKAEVLLNRPGEARVALREMYNFADCYQVGILEGVMRHCGLDGEIRLRTQGVADVECACRWRLG